MACVLEVRLGIGLSFSFLESHLFFQRRYLDFQQRLAHNSAEMSFFSVRLMFGAPSSVPLNSGHRIPSAKAVSVEPILGKIFQVYLSLQPSRVRWESGAAESLHT